MRLDDPLVIVLPYATPSQNETLRWHWAKTKKMRGNVALAVQCAMRRRGVPVGWRPDRRMRVSVVRHSSRCLDYGNLVGGFKVFLDALTDAGAIFDDTPKWVDERYSQEYAPRPKTVITVGEVM